MNVDRGRLGTSVPGFRILAAVLVLIGAGCAFLGWGSRQGQTSTSATNPSRSGFEIAAQGLSSTDAHQQAALQMQGQASSILAGLPLVFEPNLGQGNLNRADNRARFVTHGSGYSLALGDDGAVLTLATRNRRNTHGPTNQVESFHLKLARGNSSFVPRAEAQLPGKSNYFIGNDPAKWQHGVPQFARVRYQDVYPGINLVFYGNDGHLEYDFQVAPGADPRQAELEFEGAKHLALEDGALVVRGERGSVLLNAPIVYQNVDGRKQAIEGAFILRGGNRAGFVVGEYDRSRELIIDPILNFSTYFGGSGDEHNTSVAVDAALNIYLAGSTTSTDLPHIPGVVQPGLAGAENVYIAKIQPPLGSQPALLLSMTYLGGSGTDYPVGIKVDGEGNPFVAGTTTSGNFPVTDTNAYQSTPETPGTHVFVTKMKFDFTQLTYSSYLSGNGTDIASGMTIDNTGAVYVTGTTTSNDTASTTDQFPASTIPNKFAFQSVPRASIQFFVTKVDTTAPHIASVPYSTYFGGGTFNTSVPVATGGGIAVDGTNTNIYFTGTTNFTYSGCLNCGATDFPILNAYQPCLDSPTSTNIVNPQSCANTSNPSASDAFVAKLNPNAAQGQQLLWSTYLGGTADDLGTGVALDSGATNVYVVGTTSSSDFIDSLTVTSYASYQKCLNNEPPTPASGTVTCSSTSSSSDAFVARLSNPANTTGTPTLVALNYFSYLGGANTEVGSAITVDSNSGALITGSTMSPSSFTLTGGVYQPNSGTFPVSPYPSSIQSNLNGPQDAFIARLNTGAVIGQTTTASWASYFGGSGTDAGTGITLDVNQNGYLAGETNSTDLQVAKALQTNNAGGYDSFVTQLGTALSLSIQGQLSLGTNQQFISAGNPATFTYTVTNNGPDSATGIVVSANLSPVVTGVQFSNVGATVSSGTCGAGTSSNTGVSCGPISLQSGSTATVTITATPVANSSGSSPVFFNGGTVQAMAPGNIVLAQTSVPAQMSDFSISVSPSNFAVPIAGATAQYTVQLTPHPIYTSSISLSCSQLPPATTCAFTSPSVTLSSASGATSTLNITTTARPVTTPTASLWVRRFYAFWFAFPGLAILGLGRDRRRRRVLGILLLCTLFMTLLLLPSCSHSSTQVPPAGTPAGTYSVVVTAASGGDSKTQTVGLSVP